MKRPLASSRPIGPFFTNQSSATNYLRNQKPVCDILVDDFQRMIYEILLHTSVFKSEFSVVIYKTDSKWKRTQYFEGNDNSVRLKDQESLIKEAIDDDASLAYPIHTHPPTYVSKESLNLSLTDINNVIKDYKYASWKTRKDIKHDSMTQITQLSEKRIQVQSVTKVSELSEEKIDNASLVYDRTMQKKRYNYSSAAYDFLEFLTPECRYCTRFYDLDEVIDTEIDKVEIDGESYRIYY